MDYQQLAPSLKALADKTRLQIIERIHQGQLCGCELLSMLDISQPTLSHHLKVLSRAGFIEGVKTQNKIHYTVQTQTIHDTMNALAKLLSTDVTTVVCEERKHENV